MIAEEVRPHRSFGGESVPTTVFPCGVRAHQDRHLQDGEASRHAVGDGAGPGGPQQTVAEVDHLDAAQVLQGLKETRAVHLRFSTTSHTVKQANLIPLALHNIQSVAAAEGQ